MALLLEEDDLPNIKKNKAQKADRACQNPKRYIPLVSL